MTATKPRHQLFSSPSETSEHTDLDVVTVASVLQTNKGCVVCIFHEYAHFGKGNCIHASGQMEWLKCEVDDSSTVSGSQPIHTLEG